ncbi:hypothetical protein AAG570_002091 [Ranatra chinensis]|uniref:Uncharacterized protein n=1 Tax=Ranatra chinensis TaxID=642074 RepID=A0ABD0YAG4_9HEMI
MDWASNEYDAILGTDAFRCVRGSVRMRRYDWIVRLGSIRYSSEGGVSCSGYVGAAVVKKMDHITADNVPHLFEAVFHTEGKVEAIKKLQVPDDVKGVRSVMGLINFYRRFLPGLADRTERWNHLTKKAVKFEITDDMLKSLDWAKEHLRREPVLRFPDFTKQFVVKLMPARLPWGPYSHRGAVRSTFRKIGRNRVWEFEIGRQAQNLDVCRITAELVEPEQTYYLYGDTTDRNI